MNTPLRLIMLAFLVLGLNGCGLKGPLFIPPAEKSAPKPTPAAPAAHSQAGTASPGNTSTSPASVQP